MSKRQKVVWNEGMCLEPQHFQQWDRHVHYLLDSTVRTLVPYVWGISEIRIDREALANGTLALVRCLGIFPDGLRFSIPEEDPAPPAQSIKELMSPTDDHLSVYLTVPVEKEGGRNCRLEGDTDARETRYISGTVPAADDNTGLDERDIAVGRADLQLRVGSPSMEGLSIIKIAEIVRAPHGSFLLSDKYIPPCLALEASDQLMTMIRRMIELLVGRASALAAALGGALSKGPMPQDIRFILALQSLQAAIPVMNHFYTTPKTHPEVLFRTYLDLAGQLSLHSSEADINPRNFPRYVHENLGDSFGPLDLQIRLLLDGLTPSAKYVPIPLDRKNESLYVSQAIDPDLLKNGQVYLLVSGDMPERRMIDDIPVKLRVASPDTIGMVLSSFRKALAVQHVTSPPSNLPVRIGGQYFHVEASGPFWEGICNAGALAIFIPAEMSHLSLEAMAF